MVLASRRWLLNSVEVKAQQEPGSTIQEMVAAASLSSA